MSDPNSPRYFPRADQPAPEIPPPPGDLPKKFPESQPLSDDGLEGAKKAASSPGRTGSGEDPSVESGVTPNDPERPQRTGEEPPL